MTIEFNLKNKLLIAGLFTFLTSAHVIWDFYHGGVPVHYFLASEDMPGFSNWWGVLTIPILTWIVISLVQRRNGALLDSAKKSDNRIVLIRFLVSLLFGMTMSIFWELGLDEILQFLILLPVVFSFFKPAHFPENLLGFVLGMIYTFGGVLPIIIGSVLLLLNFIAYGLIRKGILFLVSKIR